jgi:tetratricopeptide (TPR) repeat protein
MQRSGIAFKLIFFIAACVALCPAHYSQVIKTAAAYRSITVESEPDATVWVDDVRYGKTGKAGTLSIATISPGTHRLKLRADGFAQKVQTLTAAQKGVVKVVLTKTTDEAELAFQEGERFTAKDRDKAIEAYRKAIKLRSNYPEAYLALARALSDAGDLDEARTAIASARKLRPAYAEASAVEGRIFKDAGDEEKAIAAFKRAITEGKGFQPEANAGLGLLYKERAEVDGGSGNFQGEDENYNESAKYLKTALKQLSGAPDAMVIYQLLGLIYERQQKTNEAIAVYEEFLRFFPDTAEASAVRSFIVQLRKDQQTKQ